MAYQRRSFSPQMVPLPQSSGVDPLRSLSEMAQLAGQQQQLKSNKLRLEKEQREVDSQKSIEQALAQTKGDIDATITLLEGSGKFSEGQLLRGKRSEIQKNQQQALYEGLRTTGEKFQLATQYLQGVEEEQDPTRKAELFSTIRPKLTELLPGFEQHIPQDLESDPGFVARAIPFGLNVQEIANRRADATKKLNENFAKQGDTLKRDHDVLDALEPWIDSAENGEEINNILDQAEKVYGASPAVRQRFGNVPPGPITPDGRKALVSRLKTPTDPASIDAAILAAQNAGDTNRVTELLDLKKKSTAAGRVTDDVLTPQEIENDLAAIEQNPNVFNTLTPTRRDKLIGPLRQAGFNFNAIDDLTPSQKASIERWRSDALQKLASDKDFYTEAGAYEAEKARIEDSYKVQMGTSAAKPAAKETPKPGAVALPPGLRVGAKVTLRDGRKVEVTTVNPDGTFLYK